MPQKNSKTQPVVSPGKKIFPYRISLRYKLTFPIILFVSFMIFSLFYTTFNLVHSLVLGGVEDRLKALTNVFGETLKGPLLVKNKDEVVEIVKWMGEQEIVKQIRIEDSEGKPLLQTGEIANLPQAMLHREFMGIQRISSDEFVVASFIQSKDRLLGRVVVVYSRLGVEAQLKRIFQERILIAFLLVMVLALFGMITTWLAVRPIFALEKAAKRILAGDLDARSNIRSFDEIQDLSQAFDEMVGRLGMSLDRLRLRTEALEESEEKYRLIVENASDIIFTLTPDGELVLLNRGFSGCSREEFLHEGLPLILSLHSPESKNIFHEALEDVMRTKQAVDNVTVTHIMRASKAEIFYLVNLTPVVGHDNEVKLIQGVMRDITEMKRIDIMKDSLIRDVAHELKTPVAKFAMAITWFDKEMEKMGNKEAYKDILAILRNNIDRLMQTITSIMDLSKLESGMDKIVKTSLDLNDVLREVAHDMGPMVEQKKLEFVAHFSEQPLPMQGDAHMLYRLFCNLLQNSMKFTESGKIVLTGSREEGQIHVKVQDKGCGLEEKDLEVIFDRFVQKTAASSGIGVGLTICRDIAALHDGKIWAESAGLGQGATFHVIFPLS